MDKNFFNNISLVEIKFDGAYKIADDFNIAIKKKPSRLHRFFTKLLLGWVWIDDDKL